MTRLLMKLAAHYHAWCLHTLRRDRAWYMRHGTLETNPYVRGLDYCINHHDRALAGLGYILASKQRGESHTTRPTMGQ